MFPKGLLQEYAGALSLVSRFLDILCVVVGAVIAFLWKFGNFKFPQHYEIAVLITALLTLIVFSTSGIYTSWRGKRFLHQARIVTLVWMSVVVILILLAFLTKTSTLYSRQWMAMWTFTGWGFLILFRFGFYKLLEAMRARGWNHKRIIVVGTGELARNVAQNIRSSSWTGLDVVAFYDDNTCAITREIDGIDVKCGENELDDIVSQNRINEVWLALPLKEEDRMKKILHDLRHNTATIRFVPGIFEFRLLNHAVTEVAGLPVIDLNASPLVGLNRFIKELEDKVLSLLILVLVSPLFLFIAVGIKLTSHGPVFFRQERVSWNGKPFVMYKFRSMPVNVESKSGPVWAKPDELRATKLGAFLRKTSLDELPQFWNVLKGDMSIVGPRPERPFFVEKFKEEVPDYMKKHLVKAGITGWAQINGWRGDTDINKRIEFDLFYVENWSLWFDIKIIILTLFKGFVHKHAY
jgi:putative colanic acid biosynthesis UDP-glucose lipid carrier transferase